MCRRIPDYYLRSTVLQGVSFGKLHPATLHDPR